MIVSGHKEIRKKRHYSKKIQDQAKEKKIEM